MVSDRELDVFLDGILAGRLTQSAAGNLTFAYDDAYRADRGATPLSLSMPLAVASHPKRAARPWLEGLLPDNGEALQALGHRFSVSPRNPFALLEHVGIDAAGAVQILPAGVSSSDSGSRGDVRLVSDREVADMLRKVIVEYTEGTSPGASAGRFSLAGAQPKIALHRTPEGAWGVPQDATPTTHILKPVVGRFSRIDTVELLTMRAAAHLGNAVAHTGVQRFDDQDVLVSQRYDRITVDGALRRRHQEDLCQALSVSPQKKYQRRDGGPGLAEIARLLSSLPIAADRTAAARAFYRAFVFNVVAGCTDAHAKNYSLLLDGRSVTLAPLYDLLTFAGYWDGHALIDSAMSVGGEYAFQRISADALVREGTRFGYTADEAADLVTGVRRGVVEAFETARESLTGLGPDTIAVADDVVRGVRNLPLVAR